MREFTRIPHAVLLSILVFALAKPAWAVSVTSDELSEASRWVATKFQGKSDTKPVEGYLMVYTRSGSVEKNGIKDRPFRILNKEYQRGLHFPSVGKVLVHLPGAGKSFDAVVGLDSNDVNYYDNSSRGTVIASVEVGGKASFRSAVMREGMPGVPVKVALGDATDFALKVDSAGEDAIWNQADWAEARVTLADGKTIWLGDLPIGPMRPPYTLEVPFSFRYGDRSSRELLKGWELKRGVRQLDEQRTEHTLTYTDPKTGLEVRCVAVAYEDFPTVEWTLHFKNSGTRPTPILEEIEALDTQLERNGEGEFVLHHGKGSPNSPTDYEPFETVLGPKVEKRISAAGGRPTNSDLSYFNVEWPGEGVIIVVGWPGQWAAEFRRDEGNGLRLRTGQELTHFKLLPGEEVRSPLMVMQFWKGDWVRAQNIWRRWMIAHNLPRPGGKLPPPQIAAGSNRQLNEAQDANEENQKAFADRYLEEGLKLDYWWIDAGWYRFREGWWNTGTWEPDPKRFPRGFRPVADHLHSRDLKLIVWFEPERVRPGTWLYENHPEWLLGRDGENKLLNLGDPEAQKWLTGHIDRLITEQGIDLYRQDFNFDPLSIWRANDAEDRQGITEIRHVMGYLAYWDELRRRHPNLLIDTCASGGRRNDLETLRRAVPLWRSDYAYESTAMQNHTYGIGLWIPFFGTGINAFDPYTFRSQMTVAAAVGWDLRRKDRADYDLLRHLIAQWRQVAPFYYGDYYPMTDYSTGNDVWVAWQFDRPESGDGMVQAFRRRESPFESAHFRLRGLDPKARYRITDLDVPGATEFTGRDLTESGLPVVLKSRPDSAIVTYQQVR